MATKTPLALEVEKIANQSFVTKENQAAFGVDTKADVAQTGYKAPAGITTSDSAANRNKAANETLASMTPPATTSGGDKKSQLSSLMLQLSDLQTKLAKAKDAERKVNEERANEEAKNALDSKTSAEEVGDSAQADLSAGVDAIAGKGTTDGIEDPVIRALSEKTSANLSIISNQMQTLDTYRQQFNEYTQQDIGSIARTAARSAQRQAEENQRTTDAMRFAGVLGGRAQFAPVVEQSIIKDVIQEGLDKIEVINEKKNTAIREARKAEAEFNVDAFEQQAELAKEYNNEIESTISAMNAQVRQVEADEREKITFRQEQEERNSLVLAEELIDATPDMIMQTAAANGINAGLLMKAVNDAKFEKANREFEGKNQALTLESQRASINASNRSNQPDEKPVPSDIPEDVEQGFRSVARLSKADAEATWNDIKTFGLNEDSVSMWLEGGLSKSQVKAIVSAHEQSQRVKGEDDVVTPTETETTLSGYVDSWKSGKNKKAEQDVANLITGQFFKAN